VAIRTETVALTVSDGRTMRAHVARPASDHVHVEFARADHGFFCHPRATYHPTAAAEAWALTLKFLDGHLRD